MSTTRRRGGAGVVAVVAAWAAGCGGGDDGVAVDADTSPRPDAPAGALLVERFDGDGDGWPAGWTELGGVAAASRAGGRGRLTASVSDYSLGRMGHALDAVDVEARYALTMDEPGSSGVGFYVRQNGGYLGQTSPTGGGYAAFVEAFRGPRIGLWRERDGNEEELTAVDLPAIAAGVTYEVRFRVTQDGATTALAASIWEAGTAEPSTWTVTTTDGTAGLQGVAGGVAIDAWSTATPAGGVPAAIFVDDVVITAP